MTQLEIALEEVGQDLIAAYAGSGMERGLLGEDAIRWAFRGGGKCFAVARSEGEVVGMSGYIRTRMQFGPSRGVGYQAVDSFVSPSQRGKGVFSSLAREFHQGAHDADLTWGFPNDNAAPAWFGRLGWQKFGQVPFLIKPLRSGFFMRKAGLSLDFPLGLSRDQKLEPVRTIENWADSLWDQASHWVGCATIRDADYLAHRLFAPPHASAYRVVASEDHVKPALVASREAHKHGGHIAYLMEAMGCGATLRELLESELARLRDRGVELVLAWSHRGSPSYRTLRRAGFLPFPERLRPIHIWFGARPKASVASQATDPKRWYLSYLDSDTV